MGFPLGAIRSVGERRKGSVGTVGGEGGKEEREGGAAHKGSIMGTGLGGQQGKLKVWCEGAGWSRSSRRRGNTDGGDFGG